MGKWYDDSACWDVHDVRLYSVLDTLVKSGEDVCCSVMFGTLVGVFMFSVMWCGLSCWWYLLLVVLCGHQCMSVIVECAFTSPVRTECGMFVMCCMSVSAVLYCVDVLSRGGTYMFVIVICLVLLMCTLIIWSSVWNVCYIELMLSQMSVLSPPPALCNLSVRIVVKLCTLGVLALG